MYVVVPRYPFNLWLSPYLSEKMPYLCKGVKMPYLDNGVKTSQKVLSEGVQL